LADKIAEFHYGCPEQKIRVVPHGYDQALYNDRPVANETTVLQERGLQSGQYLLYLGTLQKRKNIINLVRAYEQLDTALPLVLAGGPGWFYEEIKQAIAQSPKASQIFELGYVDQAEKPVLYRNCAAFIYPSLYEGFGLPIVEAMASGVPVVCSNVSSMPEVAGDTCVLVDPSSVESIAEGIQRALGDTSMERRAARLLRAKQFSWARSAELTMAALAEVAI
jgi:glycosyltransferase involved in cell wall biosynthesis